MDLQENERVMVDWATYMRHNDMETLRERRIPNASDYDSTGGILDGYQPEVEETDSEVAFKPSTL